MGNELYVQGLLESLANSNLVISEDVALPSAARTTNAQGTSADFTNTEAKGVMLFINVTANPGAQTLTPRLEFKDAISGAYALIPFTATIGANGLFIYTLYPGASSGGTDRLSLPLPKTWRVNINPSGVGSWTYSVGFCYLP